MGRFDPALYLPDTPASRQRIYAEKPALQGGAFPSSLDALRTHFADLPDDAKLEDIPDYLAAMAHWYYTPGNLSFREFIAQQGLFKIERTLRHKSSLDTAFFHSTHALLGEAFRFSELSRNRRVLALDVNSMFPWLLKTARFPDSARLRHEVAGDLLQRILSGRLDHGLFLCGIRYLDPYRDCLNRLAPIFCGIEGRSVPLTQAPDETFVVWLHAIEVRTLAPYCEIAISEGIHSDASIGHPLAGWVDNYYAKKQRGTPIERKVAKAALTTLHTAASRVRSQSTPWLDRDAEQDLFHERFRAKPFVSGRYAQILAEDARGRRRWRLYNPNHPSSVHCLAATVYAHARARLFSLLKAIEDSQLAKVCYANIDSVHLAVQKGQEPAILDFINDRFGIGNDLGQLKIEAQADHGLWLDAGVYWLFNRDGTLVKHAALDPNPAEAFATWRTYLYDDPITGDTEEGRLGLLKSLATHKRLAPDNTWRRLNRNEVRQGPGRWALDRIAEAPRIMRTFDFVRHRVAGR